VELESN